jgi:phosphatidylserine/phosphatidylglycerophosphate/cardiolipin synthase-like enzyme
MDTEKWSDGGSGKIRKLSHKFRLTEAEFFDCEKRGMDIILYMTSHSDLTFLTNEEGNTLSDRFRTLIKDTQYFDVLVWYFYTSGFWQIYPEIESSEKIRILIGISTNREVYDTIQQSLSFSHTELKNIYSEKVSQEIENVKEAEKVEKGINIFIEWLRSGKLEIRAYPTEKIHAKLYVMTFHEGDRDVGRVITGSSNFTASGLRDNLEFNVELKNRSDYDYAKSKVWGTMVVRGGCEWKIHRNYWKENLDESDNYSIWALFEISLWVF